MLNSGFGKIGIIVVIFLILATLTGDYFAISYLNKKSRDLQVLSEIKQIRSALEAYIYINNFYPQQTEAVRLNDSYAGTEKLCETGFKRSNDACQKNILNPIPNMYEAMNNYYNYQSVENNSNYLLEFELLTDFREINLVRGKNCANNNQIISKNCF